MLFAGMTSLCYARRVTKAVIYGGIGLRPVLVAFAFYSFVFDGWWFCTIGSVGYVIYMVIGIWYHRFLCQEEESTRLRKLAGLTLAFYPWWILTLALAQTVIPFFGWAATSLACAMVMLAPETWFRNESMKGAPLVDRLRMLVGLSSRDLISG
jgi:hypothetical protein